MSSNELSSTTVRSVDDYELDALSDDWENIFDSKIMTDYVYYTCVREKMCGSGEKNPNRKCDHHTNPN